MAEVEEANQVSVNIPASSTVVRDLASIRLVHGSTFGERLIAEIRTDQTMQMD